VPKDLAALALTEKRGRPPLSVFDNAVSTRFRKEHVRAIDRSQAPVDAHRPHRKSAPPALAKLTPSLRNPIIRNAEAREAHAQPCRTGSAAAARTTSAVLADADPIPLPEWLLNLLRSDSRTLRACGAPASLEIENRARRTFRVAA